MVGVVGAFTLAVTLVYVRTWFGVLYGLAAGLVLVAVAARLKPAVSEVLLAAIGATSVLYAVWDVASDVLFRHSGQSDAAALARLTGVPARGVGRLVGRSSPSRSWCPSCGAWPERPRPRARHERASMMHESRHASPSPDRRRTIGVRLERGLGVSSS